MIRTRLYEFKEQDAYDFARYIGAQTKPHGDELMFWTCPYCKPRPTRGNTETFSINLKTGQFKCLRASCGVSGNMITLSRDFDFSLGNEVDEYYRPKKQYRRLKTPEKPIIPKDPAVKYLEGRGISEDVAKKYEITTQTEHDNILVFPFYDEKGKLQFVKYRKTDFDPEKDKNKEWCEANCKPILFGMKQCSENGEKLTITEGQLDSLSVATAGIDNAVSVPTGAKGMTWVPYCYEWVNSFSEIIVFGDHEKGIITLLGDINKRFPGKVKHVREEDYLGCKDANEILQKYGKEAVRKAVENAIPMPVSRVIRLSDVKSVNIYKLPKLKTGIIDLDRTLYGGLPFGMVCLISGKRGDGKSTLGSQIVANAIDQEYITFAYSGEMPNYLYKNWFDFQIAGRNHITENITPFGTPDRFITNKNQELINAWYQDKAFIYDSSIVENDEKEDLLKTIQKCIMQYGVKVVLIDNLMTAMYIDEQIGSDKYEAQGRFVRKLAAIAVQMDVLILLVVHKRKNSFTTDENDEVSGSADITNLAGITLGYDRGSRKEIEEGIMDETQRKLIISKNRLFGKINTKGIILSYDEKSKRIYGENDDVNRAFVWDNSGGFVPGSDLEIPFD
mgnify:CR=1 FL=1